MSAETLLNHLHKVRKNGVSRWMACCPAHDDKAPSLAVTECSDGHILIHCFAGCAPSDVLASVGMTMAELMPERDAHYFDDRPPERFSETRSEKQIEDLKFRIQVHEQMIKNGCKFSQAENKKLLDDYSQLRKLGVSV